MQGGNKIDAHARAGRDGGSVRRRVENLVWLLGPMGEPRRADFVDPVLRCRRLFQANGDFATR